MMMWGLKRTASRAKPGSSASHQTTRTTNEMSGYDPRQGYNKGLVDFGPDDSGLMYPKHLPQPEPEEDTYDVLERMAKEKGEK